MRPLPPVQTPVGFQVKRAMDMQVGDFVLAADGQYHRVSLVQQLPAKADQVVVNLMLDTESTQDKDHMIEADGVVTGDLYLQLRLGKSGK